MIFFICFSTLFLNEIIKVIIQSVRYRKLNLSWFLHGGGMPSGHSAFTSSVATLVAYLKGWNSVEFLITLTIAMITIYDARGVRAMVGKHSREINKIAENSRLEEFVGHTNWEAFIGACIGISLTVVQIMLFNPAL
ncbi:MAG TPA: divergent PAP2 family protein [Candidatus Gracilibacteria bacterium]|nr:divergent PAP2 family protein [Candidatus Gracilibacteria bacterium]